MRRLMMAVGALFVGASAYGGTDRILRTEAVVDANAEQVWEALTTKAGWESWAVPAAEVDFRFGGTIRTNYNKEAGVGGKGTITHHILSYEPQRMITTQFESEGNAPWAKLAEQCWVITRLEPIGASRTRVTETMVGWGQGPQWDESYQHFKQGNEWSMEQLKKKFANAAPDADAVLALMASMVGGEWISESTGPSGSVFRVRNIIELAPDGKGTIGRGWLGDSAGMFLHATTQVWRDGSVVMFQSLNEEGAVSRGEIHLSGNRTLAWDWNEVGQDGQPRRYTVTQAFDGADAYRMRLVQTDGRTASELVNIAFRRVPVSPPAFRALKGAGPAVEAMGIDTSLFPASGLVENPLIKEVIVKASPADVFKLWATPEGIRSWLVQDCTIDLRIGGPFELYFGGPDVPQADRGSNGCQILSYVPGEMLAFSWNAPPKFPVERAQRAWVVLTLTAAEPGQTKVRLVHTGFGTGGQWPQVREYFDAAWGRVLGALKEHCEK